MNQSTRSEKEIFSDLADLCCQPGYVHAIAALCLRDNMITYEGTMKEADMRKMSSPSRLTRSEINTLLGLMVKADIGWTLPKPIVVQYYINNTETLLEELHHNPSFGSDIVKEALQIGGFNPFEKGEVLREAIFYSGESAYSFQYLDLAIRKYVPDNSWLNTNRGFTIEQAVRVAKTIDEIQNKRFNSIGEDMRKLHPDQWTMLPFFAFSENEISVSSNLTLDTVKRVLGAFEQQPTERNEKFNTPSDFNEITAKPLLRMPNGEWLLLQFYSFAEAIYEAPFYWMLEDENYQSAIGKNRGEFTENFIAERLGLVFGNEHVHRNVELYKTKSEKLSEIDVLVVWGDRVLIVQAKSKRLTLESRKGNDSVLRADFKKAIQHAYDQGILCANTFLKTDHGLTVDDDHNIILPKKIKEIYILCIISDHYPGLNFQTMQFLKTESIEQIQSPLVIDIFALDAMTEMLQSPLRFLGYVSSRVKYARKLIVSNELVTLGYHLKNNLQILSGYHMMHIEDHFSAGLDVAMEVRRNGAKGSSIPEGILTWFGKTTIGRVIKGLESRPDTAAIDIGLLLLSQSEQMINEINHALNRLVSRTRADGKLRGVSFSFKKERSGIIFLCANESNPVIRDSLKSYCERCKYKHKANEWFGLCMSSAGPDVRFGVSLCYPWMQDKKMDELTKNMQDEPSYYQDKSLLRSRHRRTKKIGRNDPCPCGSGRKYKKCCLR